VHEQRELVGEDALREPFLGRGLVAPHARVDLGEREEREHAEVARDVRVGRARPELPELKRRGPARVEPDGVPRALPELVARGGREERRRERERVRRGGRGVGVDRGPRAVSGGGVPPRDEVEPGEHVSPLVRAADLQRTVDLAVQVRKIVPLQELVCELSEGHAARAVQARLHAGRRQR
jgi:hypothetical protein